MPIGAIPFPFGVCRICKDKATGLHYGVATCEGCKGFFKRSITKGEQFECLYNNSCDITPVTRSRCKACRFKRCMETGMSVESVRMGRIPKTEKNKVLDVFRRGGSDFNKHELIVNSTSSGEFQFDLKTTHVTVISKASVIDSISNPTSIANSNASQTCGTFNTCNSSSCQFENNSIFGACHLQTSDNNSSDGLSTCLSRVELSSVQNIGSRSHNLEALAHLKVDLEKNELNIAEVPQNGCESLQINNRSPNNQQKHSMYFSGQPNTSSWNSLNEANCYNPFSDNFNACNEPRSKYKLDKALPMVDQHLKSLHQASSFGQDKKRYSREDPSTKDHSSACSLPFSSTTSIVPSSVEAMPAHSHQGSLVETTSRPLENGNFIPFSQQGYNQHYDTSEVSQSTYKPTKGISRALVNVLMEEIVNSKGGIQRMFEKIGQKISGDMLDETGPPKRLKLDTTSNERNPHCEINGKVTSNVFANEKNVVSRRADSMNEDNMEVSCSGHIQDDCSSNQDNNAIALSPTNEKIDQKIYLNIQGIKLGMTILFKHCPEHREKIRQYRLGLINLRILTEDDVEETYLKLIECIPDVNERILGFCNCVPGLKDINVNDKALLMKRAYYDIWMLTSAEYFNGQESMLFLVSGEIYSAPVMRKILNDEIVDTILKFANQFNALGLTDLEKAILCGVRLCAPAGRQSKGGTNTFRIVGYICIRDKKES